MKKLILLLVLFSVGLNGQSQRINQVAENFIIESQNFVTNNSTRGIKDVNVTGSRFITNFQFGKVIGYNRNYLLRYDAFNDQMEVKKTDDEIGIIDKKTINEVNLSDGSKYKIYNYTLGEKNKNGYLKVIFSGSKSSLLKKEVIRYIPEKKAESSYDSDVKAAYKKASDVYFVSDHNGVISSFSKKKDLLKLFPAKKKALEKFIKTNKIKFSDEDSLVKLGRYIDSNS